MARSSLMIWGALVLTTLLALAPAATHWSADSGDSTERLPGTGGRVQLATDEHDVGLAEVGTELEVCFVIGNAGADRLVLRQAGGDEPYPAYVVSPGRTIAIAAHLQADELLAQGRKHIRFLTSDPHCPELWFTIRGTVAGHAQRRWDELPPRSVLIRR